MRWTRKLNAIVCTMVMLAPTINPVMADDIWPGADSDSRGSVSSGAPGKKLDTSDDDLIFDGDNKLGTSSTTGNSSSTSNNRFPRGEHASEEALQAAPSLRSETPATSSTSTPAAPSSQGSTRTLVGSAKSTMLFGRIDQIAAEAEVKMPEFKAMTAKLDTSVSRSRPLQSSLQESRFTGNIASSFPMDFSGLWGGSLRVWRFNNSSLAYQVDPEESKKMEQILSSGTSGNVNFVFQHTGMGGKIDLEPAQVRIMIPMQESYSYQKMAQGGQLGGLGGMVSKMMGNMKVPVMLHFGAVSTGNSMEVGISGNQIDQQVMRNLIRQLKPDVLEQQILTKNSSVVHSTGQVKNGYTETVLRFTRRSPTDLYVLAASVDYDGSGKFLRKLIMYGDVIRNQKVDTSIYPPNMGQLGGMMQGAGGSSGAGGLGSLAGIANMFGGGGAGTGSAGAMQQYANNPAIRNYLNQSGIGGGAAGNRTNGFSQVLNSLNMINHF